MTAQSHRRLWNGENTESNLIPASGRGFFSPGNKNSSAEAVSYDALLPLRLKWACCFFHLSTDSTTQPLFFFNPLHPLVIVSTGYVRTTVKHLEFKQIIISLHFMELKWKIMIKYHSHFKSARVPVLSVSSICIKSCVLVEDHYWTKLMVSPCF